MSADACTVTSEFVLKAKLIILGKHRRLPNAHLAFPFRFTLAFFAIVIVEAKSPGILVDGDWILPRYIYIHVENESERLPKRGPTCPGDLRREDWPCQLSLFRTTT